MCGIVGGHFITEAQLNNMNSTIIHRGPDSAGSYYEEQNQLGLAMRRLSIIDLESGNQPIFNENQRIIAVCNGEIFNYQKLRKQLHKLGHEFNTDHSDVEVIVHLYEEYGLDMLQMLNGMYAFVLYDIEKSLLIGARDRFGIKPLYYELNENHFIFSSELKSILKISNANLTIDPQAVSDYFSLQFIPRDRTIYTQLKKLKPGHYFSYNLESRVFDVKRYWNLKISASQKSYEEHKSVVRSKIEEAFNRWNASDVPVAISLSGGIDSNAILGILSTASDKKDFHTYSLGFKGDELSKYNELGIAEKSAKKWGTVHSSQTVNPLDLIKDLKQMVRVLGEPYGGGLPSWFIYKQMAGEVKVAHTGTGGDELFGNYGKANNFRETSRIRLARMLKSILTLNFSKAKYLWSFPKASSQRMFFRSIDKNSFLFNPEFNKSQRHTEYYIEDYFKKHPNHSLEDVIAKFDIEHQLTDEFLMMTDRFSMAFSIEARVPFLDHELVEYAFSIPSDIRVGKPTPKQFLIDSVKDVLLDEVYSRKKKGFVLPLKEWTRVQLRKDIERVSTPEYLVKQGIFKPEFYKSFLQDHLESRIDCTEKVWTFYMFQIWYEECYLKQ